MFRRVLSQASLARNPSVCVLCANRSLLPRSQLRRLVSHPPLQKAKSVAKSGKAAQANHDGKSVAKPVKARRVKPAASPTERIKGRKRRGNRPPPPPKKTTKRSTKQAPEPSVDEAKAVSIEEKLASAPSESKTLKEALLGSEPTKRKRITKPKTAEELPIGILSGDELDFQPVDVKIPPVPMLSYGLDRVLFNPGVYRLQDPRSRIYNFDPYLEKIMHVREFDFEALSEYKTSSKDEDLLAITKREGSKFTGSTSSMSGVLQHFHFLLSHWRELNHDRLSRGFPEPSVNFTKITKGPSAVLLRWKNGTYAIDADKSFDSPNIMSWLGHSLEKLLTTSRGEFERYRRSNSEQPPSEDSSGRCYHYSKLGNFLMRSQLDAHDPRLPGSGVFDLKTRAVVTIRMDHKHHEQGSGYQLRYDRGEWESYEREFYDMTRATMLKYSLQVRMGRMDGIFVAFHNVERIFGFQYVSKEDMDSVLHGQTDTCLGDQEFKFSIRLLDEILQRATEKFPETSIRLHFEAREVQTPYMSIFAEPVTEEQADEIQSASQAQMREFERDVVGVRKDDPQLQAEWQTIQDRVDEVVEDELEQEDKSDTEAEPASPEEAAEKSEQEAADDQALAAPEPVEEGPLMGWTLTTRNRVNGEYVDRPEDLTPIDNWSVEYNIKEIEADKQRQLYNKIKDRRATLIGDKRKEANDYMKQYFELLRRLSSRGREWREAQDKIDAQIGQHVYKRLGPDAEHGAPFTPAEDGGRMDHGIDTPQLVDEALSVIEEVSRLLEEVPAVGEEKS
ncbi:mitochondrial protein Pet127-domain-containing protein [Massariosphaeria phaeospora]|uniref:Mitochondrial protein Pet127-domain-containing protein n=1 Tax=Massariosphaeria phaeospora TaxID=100035 RepID=A0A7C8I557_9PLEO|nr:mitochondrial protein Pet127-domain-containing protein [Massariosphaeria phaeospora]